MVFMSCHTMCLKFQVRNSDSKLDIKGNINWIWTNSLIWWFTMGSFVYQNDEGWIAYDTVHFSSMVILSYTHSRCMLHTFWMCLAHILHASCIWQKRVWHSRKSCCSIIVRFLHLHRCIPCAFRTHLACFPDASYKRSRHVSHAF